MISLLSRLRRVTSGGRYIPEVDGLRFFSLFWVAGLMHPLNLINKKIFGGKMIEGAYPQEVLLELGHGVAIFFMISGFILMLPFIRQYQFNEKPVSLKRYYLRRLVRLEPPYIIALLLFFVLLVWVTKKFTFSELAPHLGASLLYLHNVIYGSKSWVLDVAWTLEIEIQFYILAPLLGMIFKLNNVVSRRALLVICIVGCSWYSFNTLWSPYTALPNCLCYFFSGMLIADLYNYRPPSIALKTPAAIIGVLLAIGLPFLISLNSFAGFFTKLVCLNLLMYLALTNPFMRRIFSIGWVTIIGGMCYSIYLLHLGTMSAVVSLITPRTWNGQYLNVAGLVILLLAAVLVIGALFYRFVEQPFMRISRQPSSSAKSGAAKKD